MMSAFPPRADDIGRAKFKQYRLLSFLGKGGFAEVSKFVSAELRCRATLTLGSLTEPQTHCFSPARLPR
jgi:hypothetical protein